MKDHTVAPAGMVSLLACIVLIPGSHVVKPQGNMSYCIPSI